MPITLTTDPAVLDTVSVEIESLGFHRETLSNLLVSYPKYNLAGAVSITRDASAEIITRAFNTSNSSNIRRRLYINSHTKAAQNLFAETRNRTAASTFGYELVTRPMSIENMEMFLRLTIPLLFSNGDFIHNRCAFHVHVGMVKNLKMLKNALRIGLWIDDILYRIGSMGRRFRGFENNFIYCRPLTNGQVALATDGFFYKTLNIEGALKSRNLPDFWGNFGINPERNQEKYHPARYFGYNVFAAYLHGTLEIRHSNQIMFTSSAIALVKLAQLITEMSIRCTEGSLSGIKYADLSQKKETGFFISKFFDFIDLSKHVGCEFLLDKTSMDILLDLLKSSDDIIVPKTNVLTHLRNFNFDADTAKIYDLERIRKDTLEKAGHVDIHNIQESSILER